MENIDSQIEDRKEDIDDESSIEKNFCSQSILKGQNSGEEKDKHSDDEEEIDDPQNEYRIFLNETCLQSYAGCAPVNLSCSVGSSSSLERGDSQVIQSTSEGNEVFSVAPGEGKHPILFMKDSYCEELAFPVLFPKGRYGYQVERTVKLSPVKYFNARLLHYSGRFARSPEYLFFAQFITEQKKVQDSISIALRKAAGQCLTASQVRSLNTATINQLIASDQAYYFMKNIPGTPAYWKNFLYDVLGMIKQLGPPSWWMTFSCADLKWTEIYKILAKLKGYERSNDEIDHMTYDEKRKMLNSNPIVVAKHFQYRLESMFKEILLGSGNPVGKVLYHVIRIEFQFRGSPHAHCFIWIKNCPILTNDNIELFVRFIDKHVSAVLPNSDKCPVLHTLVKTYQTHTHSKMCRKYRNLSCRFNFGHYFTERTIISKPISENMIEEDRKAFLRNREPLLSKVKDFINKSLNPSDRMNYRGNLSIDEILDSLQISKNEYYEVLSFSAANEHEIRLR